MAKIFALIVLVILLAGGWYFYQNRVEAPTTDMVKDVFGNVQMGTEATTTTTETGTTTSQVDPEAKIFNLTAKNFEFSQKEMRVKKGETVTVNFESTGGLHDWVVDEFKARTQQVEPGTKTSVTFVADKAGTFEYYCSVGQHRKMGMAGKLVVE